MARAAIVGAAMSPFGKRPEVNLWDLGWPVVKAAMRDAGLDREAINAVYAGSAFSDRLVGQRIVRSLGMLGIPVVNCENACSSGGTAFREAVRAVEDGHHDVVLVIGFDMAKGCAKKVYEQAGLGPEDVQVVELHDCFTTNEVLTYEALGLCGRGEGIELLESGATSIGGRIPINPSGGLLCKGHPVGATGVAQLVEITWQLRGEAGARQVEDARIGLTHCTGGGIAGLDHGACTINILAR